MIFSWQCFFAKTTLPGFRADQPICLLKCQVAKTQIAFLFAIALNLANGKIYFRISWIP